MLGDWLEERPQDRARTFAVSVYAALPINEAMQGTLARELLRSYASMRLLRDRAARSGLPRLADYISNNVLPRKPMTRIGDFGEVLTGLIMRRMGRYTLPVLKLRYKPSPDSPLQGVDVLAFRFRGGGEPILIAVVEVKTTTVRPAETLGAAAVAQLRAGLEERLPRSLHFIQARLLDSGREWLAGKVAEALDSDTRELEEHVVLVADLAMWDYAVLDRIESDGLGSAELRTNVYLIADLRTVIDAMYASAAAVNVLPL